MTEELLKELYKIVRRSDPDLDGFDVTYSQDVEDLLDEARRQIKSLRLRKDAYQNRR